MIRMGERDYPVPGVDVDQMGALGRIGEASRRLWKGNLERREVKLLGLLRRYEVTTIWKVVIISDFAHSLTRAELEQAINSSAPPK